MLVDIVLYVFLLLTVSFILHGYTDFAVVVAVVTFASYCPMFVFLNSVMGTFNGKHFNIILRKAQMEVIN